MYIQEHILS